MSATRCPKCDGAMVEGYAIDHSYAEKRVANWVEGAPEKSVWFGLRTGKRRVLPIASWRCERCGFLESYAPA